MSPSTAADQVLITAEELNDQLGSDAPVILDVRWGLGLSDGRLDYAAGHVPGAVYANMDTQLAAPPSQQGGRHPLPVIEDLQASARAWGISSGSRVVVYDDANNMAAARGWWLLRWAGLPDVRLMDGGLGAWRRAGFELETGMVSPPPGDVDLTPGHMPVLEADDAAALARSGILLDARSTERFRGEAEPIDPVAGHIPGAVSAPTTETLAQDGRFAPAADLAARFRSLGVDRDARVGVYCGSGVTAAHEIAALAAAGFGDAALYPGSWSQWCGDPARPVATGA